MFKVKFIAPLLVLLALGGAYKVVLVKPTVEKKPKIDGDVYVLPKPFLVNLAGDRYATFSVALTLPHGVQPGEAEGGEEAEAEPPEGFGALPQEGVVRALITDTVTGRSSRVLLNASARERLSRQLLIRVRKQTDVQLDDLFFTDLALQ